MENLPQDNLSKDMARLARAVEKSNSLFRRLLSGIMYGLGVAVGATLIGAVVIALAWRFLRATGFTGVAQSLGISVPSAQSLSPELLQQLPDFLKTSAFLKEQAVPMPTTSAPQKDGAQRK